jgi:hypothetical protein
MTLNDVSVSYSRGQVVWQLKSFGWNVAERRVIGLQLAYGVFGDQHIDRPQAGLTPIKEP